MPQCKEVSAKGRSRVKVFDLRYLSRSVMFLPKEIPSYSIQCSLNLLITRLSKVVFFYVMQDFYFIA